MHTPAAHTAMQSSFLPVRPQPQRPSWRAAGTVPPRQREDLFADDSTGWPFYSSLAAKGVSPPPHPPTPLTLSYS